MTCHVFSAQLLLFPTHPLRCNEANAMYDGMVRHAQNVGEPVSLEMNLPIKQSLTKLAALRRKQQTESSAVNSHRPERASDRSTQEVANSGAVAGGSGGTTLLWSPVVVRAEAKTGPLPFPPFQGKRHGDHVQAQVGDITYTAIRTQDRPRKDQEDGCRTLERVLFGPVSLEHDVR